jgi:Na+/proline symporter
MSNPIFWAFAGIVAISVIKSFFLKWSKEKGWVYYSRATEGHISLLQGILSIYGAVVGGFIIFGLVQIGFQGGLTGYILGFSYLIGAPLLLFSMKRIQKEGLLGKGLISLDALLRSRFGPLTETVFIIVTSLLFTGVLAGQFIAVAAFLREYTGSNVAVVTLAIGCLLTIAYTVIYGLRAVIANDVIQGIFEFSLSIIIPVAVLYYIVGKSWGFSPLSQGIGGEYGASYPIVGGIFLALSFIVRADLWQRLSLVEPKKQKFVIGWVVFGLLIYYLGMTAVGMILQQNPELFPFVKDTPLANIVPVIIREVIGNPVLQVFCISGLLLALLSSIDSYLNLVGVLIGNLYSSQIEKESNLSNQEKNDIRVTNARIASVGIALATVILAILIPDLVDIMSASFGLIGIIVPIVVVALIRKQSMPDYVGAIPVAVSVILLLGTMPSLKKLAFIPATLLGWVLFAVLIATRRTKKLPETPAQPDAS